MRRLNGRLDKLERMLHPRGTPRERLRVVTCGMDRAANLANATCKRTLCENGLLLEVVHLDGDRDGLTDEQLDKFVESFPIENLKRGATGWQCESRI